MTKSKIEYVVVENAGYESENDRGFFTSESKAQAFIDKHYEPEEIESLHVEIAKEIDGTRTYEF